MVLRGIYVCCILLHNIFMNNIKKIFFKTAAVSVIAAAVLYILFLTLLPFVLSSHTFLDAIDEIIAEKTGIVLKSERLKVKTYPDLAVDIAADKFNIDSEDTELLKVKNAELSFDLKKFKAKRADIEYIYLNQKHFSNVIKKNKHKKTSDFKLKNLPPLNVKNIEIHAGAEGKTADININNLKIENTAEKTICSFGAEIISNFLKDSLIIPPESIMYLENNVLYADNIEIKTGSSSLVISGQLIDSRKQPDFTVKGKDLPVSDIAASIIYMQKLQDNSKKFMENFYDYSGRMHADLRITHQGIFGRCRAVKLAGKTVLFNVPVLFEEAPFVFNGREFSGGAFGLLGAEKVYADFQVINAFTKDLESKGTVQAVLTNKSVSYVPEASIKGGAPASVYWHIKNKIIDVKYSLDIPAGSDIYYQNANLGLEDKQRSLYVKTLKRGDELAVEHYDYSIENEGIKTPVLTGEGMFTRINGTFTPDYITCRTENDAPVSAAASFYNYARGGVFNGDLKYDFRRNKITGVFNIKDTSFKRYKIKEVKIDAKPDIITASASGTYRKSPFSADISGVNDFSRKIKINSLNLFLDELNVNKEKMPKKHMHSSTEEKKIKKSAYKFDIDLYTIKLNRIIYKNALLENILVTGSIKDDIFNFEADYIKFAKGYLTANGMYDFNTRTSKAVFTADDIDADTAAAALFYLPGQIEGVTDAVLNINTSNGIENKKGHLTFKIKGGYLPELGSTEFIINRSNHKKPLKFQLQNIVNVDMKDMKSLASDIDGAFDINNKQIDNMHITSKQKYLSLLALGCYNTESRHADINLFGKYNNKEISRIKIFFVPLSLVIKLFFKQEKAVNKYEEQLKETPDVTAEDKKDVSAFRVKIKGNLHTDDLKVELKSL